MECKVYFLLTFVFTISWRANCQELRYQTTQSKPSNKDAGFRFASYYNDHMVLQKAPQQALIWGYADEAYLGQIVHAVLSDNKNHISTYNAVIKKGPKDSTIWAVQVKPMPAGGPFNLQFKLQSVTIQLLDILFGDVWVCSGQSNMQFSIPQMFTDMVEHEYNNTYKYQDIRLFTTAMETSKTPLIDLKGVMQNWTAPSPAAFGKGQKAFTYFSAVCWLYGRHLYETLGYPIGLVASVWGGTPDEAWSSPDALKQCGIKSNNKENEIRRDMKMSAFEYKACCGGPGGNSELWNAMIHPLLNMTIKGAIWYQGESDAAKNNYNCTFPAMIQDWRQKFFEATKAQVDVNFPFGFVQLAGYKPPAPGNITSGFSELRWQQTANYGYVPNLKQPNVFMAVAMDLPDYSSPYGNIHPRDKETVGKRLAAAGLAQAYKMSARSQGPLPSKFQYIASAKAMVVEYDKSKTVISVRSSWGFELCCPKTNDIQLCDSAVYGSPWVDAPIVGHGPTSVIISTQNCTTQFGAIRYAWRQSPCNYKLCAVYSVEDELPAPPLYIKTSQLTQIENNVYRFGL